MAKLTVRPAVDIRLKFEVDEEEARALDALAGYADDAFIKMFYDKLGKSYMQPHEAGLRRFLSSIREFVPSALSQLNQARKVFDGTHEVGKVIKND